MGLADDIFATHEICYLFGFSMLKCVLCQTQVSSHVGWINTSVKQKKQISDIGYSSGHVEPINSNIYIYIQYMLI